MRSLVVASLGCCVICYHFASHWQGELTNRLSPIHEETVTGEAAVLKVFKLTGRRKASVAGCQVKTGSLDRKSLYRVTRNNNVLFEGEFLILHVHVLILIFAFI